MVLHGDQCDVLGFHSPPSMAYVKDVREFIGILDLPIEGNARYSIIIPTDPDPANNQVTPAANVSIIHIYPLNGDRTMIKGRDFKDCKPEGYDLVGLDPITRGPVRALYSSHSSSMEEVIIYRTRAQAEKHLGDLAMQNP